MYINGCVAIHMQSRTWKSPANTRENLWGPSTRRHYFQPCRKPNIVCTFNRWDEGKRRTWIEEEDEDVIVIVIIVVLFFNHHFHSLPCHPKLVEEDSRAHDSFIHSYSIYIASVYATKCVLIPGCEVHNGGRCLITPGLTAAACWSNLSLYISRLRMLFCFFPVLYDPSY